nr:hypothetical protein [Shiraia sp. slf14]
MLGPQMTNSAVQGSSSSSSSSNSSSSDVHGVHSKSNHDNEREKWGESHKYEDGDDEREMTHAGGTRDGAAAAEEWSR